MTTKPAHPWQYFLLVYLMSTPFWLIAGSISRGAARQSAADRHRRGIHPDYRRPHPALPRRRRRGRATTAGARP